MMGCAVYLLTMSPTVSFWDCGEFIATSYGLQVGHPPGAPFYQLIAHLFTLMAPTPAQVAWWSNLLSALCGGLTAMMLYWTLRLLTGQRDGLLGHLPALTGSLCFLFCDTAWFSAVESEVYSLAMLMAATLLWCAMRYRESRNPRWLVLASLCAGLSLCVHELCLLALPAAALMALRRPVGLRQLPAHIATRWRRRHTTVALWCALMFAIGLTPYLIVPIRAAANPPINNGDPSTAERFLSYLSREQYAHAPLYPRMWRHQAGDDYNASLWSGGRDDAIGNATFFVSYQLTYMYMRYLLWNFAGRYNDWQGFGSLQKGQFITGIGFIDRLLVGTAARPPDSMPATGRAAYLLLPLLLGIVGAARRAGGSRTLTWAVWLLFLFGGPLLAVYLNHPAYEPRERDYAYVVSFYAFCLWIGIGAEGLTQRIARLKVRWTRLLAVALLAVPLLMAQQNWPSHDHSRRLAARDVALNILASCPSGAILFTWGDNDTFPLWYAQQVERLHTDIETYNINLIGINRFHVMARQAAAEGRAVCFSHYAEANVRHWMPYAKQLQLIGYAYRLSTFGCDSIEAQMAYSSMMQRTAWHNVERGNLSETAIDFLAQYWRDVLAVAATLTDEGRHDDARRLLLKTIDEAPPHALHDPALALQIAKRCREAGMTPSECAPLEQQLRNTLSQWIDYYATISPRYKVVVAKTEEDLREMQEELNALTFSR